MFRLVLKKYCIFALKTMRRPTFILKCSIYASPFLYLTNQPLAINCANNNTLPNCSRHKIKINLFMYYIQKDLIWLGLTIISAIAIAFVNILIPHYFANIINTINSLQSITFDEYLKILKNPSIKLLGLYLFQALFTFTHIFSLTNFGENIASNLRKALFFNLMHEELAFYDTQKTGDLITRLTSDVQEFKSSLKQCMTVGIKSTAQCFGCFCSIYYISPSMTFGVALLIPTLVTIGSLIATKLRKISKKCHQKLSQSANVLSEALGNIRTVKAFVGEEREVERYSDLVLQHATLSKLLGAGIATFQALTNIALNSLVLSTVVIGGAMATNNFCCPSLDSEFWGQMGKRLTAGDLMAFLLAVQTIQKSLGQLSQLSAHYVKCSTAGDKIFQFLPPSPTICQPQKPIDDQRAPWYDIELQIKNLLVDLLSPAAPMIAVEPHTLRASKIVPDHCEGRIDFERVQFTYPSRPGMPVLNGFDLHIKPGQVVALCGHSGSGKTTVVSLLENFYDANAGHVRVDGTDVMDLDPKFLRGKMIGIIDQEPLLFATTIMENIRYGKPQASDAEVIEAAKLAYAHDFVSQFPHGYETMLGERGRSLSGGEKQRIAIARAILKKPPILVLDEATSAMDTDSERKIKMALDQFLPGRTVIIIAHRMSTIRNADFIVVMSKGTIVETGSHEELLSKRGLYWTLINGQEEKSNQ